MDIYEDSMPFRFTPDGLDEAAIDALIEQTCTQVSEAPTALSADKTEPLRAHSRTGQPSPNGQAA